MDAVVKQRNKENTKPDRKKAESRDVVAETKRPAPLRLKNEPRDEKAVDKTQSKGQVKPSKLGVSKDADFMQRKTLSQAFRTEQTLRHKKLVLETQKPPSSVPPKPLLPGTYKGRVVKSKIDCFRKPLCGQDKKSAENKAKAGLEVCSKPTALSASSRTGVQNSKSWAGAQVNAQKTGPQKRIQSRAPAQISAISAKPSATTSAKPSNVTAKPSATSSTKPSTVSTKRFTVSTKPSTVSSKPSVVSRKPVMMSARPPTVTKFIKKKELLKPVAAASEKKAEKSVNGSISQYRIRVESAEERRVKLADWLASKGKTLKRPALAEKSASQTCLPHLHAEDKAQPESSKQTETEVRKTQENKVSQSKPAFSSSPSHILNTTLDLLDNSDTEPAVEIEIRMESLVMNLCEKLEAMDTPSSCRSQEHTEVKVEEETPEYEILKKEELSEELKTINEVEKTEEEDETKERKLFEDEDEEEKMDPTPAYVLNACVVKYSVKTTPFLQSVRQRVDSEIAPGTPGSLRKSSIKEFKFLTPVRRSSRIHRNSSRLPGMLNEHDPCVSSLAELELLDAADSNAYIYRKNPALLQHLPDQHPEAKSSELSSK